MASSDSYGASVRQNYWIVVSFSRCARRLGRAPAARCRCATCRCDQSLRAQCEEATAPASGALGQFAHTVDQIRIRHGYGFSIHRRIFRRLSSAYSPGAHCCATTTAASAATAAAVFTEAAAPSKRSGQTTGPRRDDQTTGPRRDDRADCRSRLREHAMMVLGFDLVLLHLVWSESILKNSPAL